jgi:hypothetical protein
VATSSGTLVTGPARILAGHANVVAAGGGAVNWLWDGTQLFGAVASAAQPFAASTMNFGSKGVLLGYGRTIGWSATTPTSSLISCLYVYP